MNFRQPGNQRQHRSTAYRKLRATPRAGAIRPTYSANAEECVIAGAARYTAGTPPATELPFSGYRQLRPGVADLLSAGFTTAGAPSGSQAWTAFG